MMVSERLEVLPWVIVRLGLLLECMVEDLLLCLFCFGLYFVCALCVSLYCTLNGDGRAERGELTNSLLRRSGFHIFVGRSM